MQVRAEEAGHYFCPLTTSSCRGTECMMFAEVYLDGSAEQYYCCGLISLAIIENYQH